MRLVGITSAGGAVTVDGETTVLGWLKAVAWIDGDLADSNTAVISTQDHEAAQTLLTIGAGEGDVDNIFLPRHLIYDEGADVLTGTSGGDREYPFMAGRPRLVIAAGGDTKTGGCILYYEED